MAAGTTPTFFDEKVLAQVASLGTTGTTTIYQAPGTEHSVLIESLVVVNKTTAAVPFSLFHKNAAATSYQLVGTMSIPGDGIPVPVIPAFTGVVVLQSGTAGDILAGHAGTGTALDVNVYGVEMK